MSFCPSCGFNMTRDETVERDGFTLDPRGCVSFMGKDVPLTKAEATLLHTVAAADGRVVSRATVASRFGMSDDPANVTSVLMCRIRKRLSAFGAPCPVKNEIGRGYRWELAQ